MYSLSLLLFLLISYQMDVQALKLFLDKKTDEFNQASFIEADPVCIPHMFSKKQDIEIAGLFAAVFAWGNRKTIIRKSSELMLLMDMSPHEFCLHHNSSDLKRLMSFRHRTFKDTDLLYFIEFLQHHYRQNESLETAFTRSMKKKDPSTENALDGFNRYFFSLPHVPQRTRKHITSPRSGSTCKRLNMYLRWMVRKDSHGVDFGIWKKIKPSQLICPIDLHVARVSRKLKQLSRKQTDWKAAVELTGRLKEFDPSDPIKYDLALFGLGVIEKF